MATTTEGKIEVYYGGRPGKSELIAMFPVDFAEAKRGEPNLWSLTPFAGTQIKAIFQNGQRAGFAIQDEQGHYTIPMPALHFPAAG
ncbi:MAG: hypothetical protein WDN46_12740 [Methylocella sp.]